MMLILHEPMPDIAITLADPSMRILRRTEPSQWLCPRTKAHQRMRTYVPADLTNIRITHKTAREQAALDLDEADIAAAIDDVKNLKGLRP
jgi:hypothetical protein